MDSKIISRILVFVVIGGLIVSPAAAADEIIVSAAASLTNVMTEIRRSFEAMHPDIHVLCNFASSGSLVQQMANGAPVDVFASASSHHMDRAEVQGLIDSRTKRIFAFNELAVIVPSRSGVSVNRVSDLCATNFKKIVLGHPDSVPAGRYAKIFLDAHGMWHTLYDRLVYTNSVRQVLDYIRRAEADAGFVYVTDAVIAENRVRIVLDANKSLNISYPIAVTRMTKHRRPAVAFCEYVTGLQGQAILLAYGFRSPE